MEDPQQRGANLVFRIDEDQKALLVSAEPDENAEPIDEAWLRERLEALGHAAVDCPAASITALLGQYNSGLPLTDLRLGNLVDAELEVTVSPDGLQVRLDIVAARGGHPVTWEQVLAELAELGVKEGILFDVIENAVHAGVAEGVLIAQGTPPQHGEDGRFESLVPEVRDRRPKMTETGHIDYRDLGGVAVVHAGDALMRRHPATAGTAGLSVRGEVIQAKPGKETMFAPNLAGVTISPDDPDVLVAAISGQPVHVANGMIVEPVYTVESVNMAIGNIEFDGSVKVRGDVCAGMTIKATGDIEIGGVAEPCNLEAGGNIVIQGGAMGSLGRKDSGDFRLRCGGTLNAGYLQQVKAVAGDSILVDDVAMQCDLAAERHIRVGGKKRGHIIGGRLQATYSITGKVLGSPNRIATLCEIGLDPALHQRQQDLVKQRGGKEMQLVEISKLLAFAKQNPGKAPETMLARARNTMQALYADIETIRGEEGEIVRKLELAQQARVIAEQAMYDGLIVQIGALRYPVRGEHGGGAIGLTDNGIGLLSLEEANPPAE
ncbi:MAG: DUF342 domain-containing protein [Rhodocyclaceae bacterium]|nr:DUF342 domain-containing protein [Rhodocyclaceae bacterium]